MVTSGAPEGKIISVACLGCSHLLLRVKAGGTVGTGKPHGLFHGVMLTVLCAGRVREGRAGDWTRRELSKTCLSQSSNTRYVDQIGCAYCKIGGYNNNGENILGKMGNGAAEGPQTLTSPALSHRVGRRAGNESSAP